MRTRAIAMALVWSVLVAWPRPAAAQKLIFLVRHAERADAGGSMQTDPPLSAAGQARAQKLAALMADAKITTIITTELQRTQQTAAPLAAKLGLTPEVVQASNPTGVVASLKLAHGTEVVLVVAHSDTIPTILKAYGQADITIGDTEYDNLFIVVPALRLMTRLRY